MSLLALTLTATPVLRGAATLAGAAGATYAVLAGMRRIRAPHAMRALARGPSLPVLALDASRPLGARRRHFSTAAWHADARPRNDSGSRHELAGRGDLNVAACGAFLDGLEGLTRAAWLEIARDAGGAERESGEELTAAIRALDAAIVARDAAVTAWLVRDAVATALHTACSRPPRERGRRVQPPAPCPDERLRLQAARVAAERAALATLVRPWLSPPHHHTLTGLFTLVAPRHLR